MSIPYFPLYVDDFEADTTHLTMAEDGAYNRLLRLCWRSPGCKLPADDAWIYRKVRAATDEEKATVKAVLAEFFTRRAGKVLSPRLCLEWEKAHDKHARRILSGSKGGKAKALKTKGDKPSNATAMLYQPEPEPEPYKKETPNGVLSPPPIDEIAQAVTAYNAAAARAGWPEVQKITPARRAALRQRLADAGGSTGWEVALAKAEASHFLTGQTSPRPFFASFDWITAPRNFTKLMEGNYDNRANSGKPQPANGRENRADPALEQIARLAELGKA